VRHVPPDATSSPQKKSSALFGAIGLVLVVNPSSRQCVVSLVPSALIRKKETGTIRSKSRQESRRRGPFSSWAYLRALDVHLHDQRVLPSDLQLLRDELQNVDPGNPQVRPRLVSDPYFHLV
jgi:hypothetical protein